MAVQLSLWVVSFKHESLLGKTPWSPATIAHGEERWQESEEAAGGSAPRGFLRRMTATSPGENIKPPKLLIL